MTCQNRNEDVVLKIVDFANDAHPAGEHVREMNTSTLVRPVGGNGDERLQLRLLTVPPQRQTTTSDGSFAVSCILGTVNNDGKIITHQDPIRKRTIKLE